MQEHNYDADDFQAFVLFPVVQFFNFQRGGGSQLNLPNYVTARPPDAQPLKPPALAPASANRVQPQPPHEPDHFDEDGDEEEDEEPAQVAAPSPRAAAAVALSADGPWRCGVCTLANDGGYKCQLCGTPRLPGSAAQGAHVPAPVRASSAEWSCPGMPRAARPLVEQLHCNQRAPTSTPAACWPAKCARPSGYLCLRT